MKTSNYTAKLKAASLRLSEKSNTARDMKAAHDELKGIEAILNMTPEEIHALSLKELGSEEAVSEMVAKTKRIIQDAIAKGSEII